MPSVTWHSSARISEYPRDFDSQMFSIMAALSQPSSMQVPVPVRCLGIVPESESYRHCNVDDLARKLYRYARPDDRIMVVSDAVFSMDGDIAPLPDMLDVLHNYEGSVLLMDEAHASGAIEQLEEESTNILAFCQLMRLSGAWCQ